MKTEYFVHLSPGQKDRSGAIGSHPVVQSDDDAHWTAGAGDFGAGGTGEGVAGGEDGSGEDIDGEYS